MATLQKFKILATQCGVAQSPTRSPRTSPLVQLPRKKTTLRMLLTRSTSSSGRKSLPGCFPRDALPGPKEIVVAVDEKKKTREGDGLIVQSHSKLKDLFVSSFEEEEELEQDKVVEHDNGDKNECEENRVLCTRKMVHGPGGSEPGLSRPAWVGFRHRLLLRKAWRPMLVSIAE